MIGLLEFSSYYSYLSLVSIMTLEIFIWASLPAIMISIYVSRRDLFPEPPKALIISISLGFLIFIPHSLFFNLISNYYWEIYKDNILNTNFIYLLETFFVAAFVEESLKFLVFLFFVSKFNAFNEPMDAIVYGVCISLGFSLMETLEWSYIIFNENGEVEALSEAQARAWSSNTLHAGCGIVMGYFLSRAFFRNKNNFIKLTLALLTPTLIHGFYNYSIEASLFLVTYAILIICAVLVLIGWKTTRERQKLKKMEFEDKVISLNLLNISSSIVINFFLVYLIINIFS